MGFSLNWAAFSSGMYVLGDSAQSPFSLLSNLLTGLTLTVYAVLPFCMRSRQLHVLVLTVMTAAHCLVSLYTRTS